MTKYIEKNRGCISEKSRTAEDCLKNKLDDLTKRVVLFSAKSNALSPLATMERGYSLVEKNGIIVKKALEIS